jgi:hypothetical protein
LPVVSTQSYCYTVPKKKAKLPLSKTHPELATEADGWDPEKITAGTGKKLSWRCKLNHTWETTPSHRLRGQSCPYCGNRKVLVGFNDLVSTNPEIAKEADGWNPKNFTAGSHKPMDWVCQKGHKWKVAIQYRARGGTNCPACVGKKVEVGFNDLKFTSPDIAAEAFGWDPTTVTNSSSKKFDWKCPKGHIYSAAVYSRTSADSSGCPVCSNRTMLQGFNDLKTTHPDIAKDAYMWDPSTVTAGIGDKKYKWVCSNSHIFESYVYSRVAGIGCGVCANTQITKGINDLGTTHPDLARDAEGWDPTKFGAGSEKKFKWKCSEGHSWVATVHSRSSIDSQIGCPTCSIYGFDPNGKGYLYFLNHSDWIMFQIGITNYPEKRLASHKKLGWEILEIRGPMDGHSTQQWETAILRMLKAKGADLSNSKIAGKFDGYTEAWSKSTFPVKSIKELMRLTEEFEEDKK